MDLSDPILSRFDILTVIRDEVKRDDDESLATFVINSHIKNHSGLRTDVEENDIQSGDMNVEEREKYLLDNLLDESHIN